MFESAELGHKLSKEKFKELEKPLRSELLNAQFNLVGSQDYSLLIVINGSDYSGKAELAHRINEWMDVHYLETLAFSEPDKHERRMPPLHRYWGGLPPRGRVGLVLGSWYNQPIGDFASGAISHSELLEALQELAHFEYFLCAERVKIVKLWLDLSTDELNKRREAEGKKKSSLSLLSEWEGMENLSPKELERLGESILTHTSTHWAPWHVVAADDARYRDVFSAQLLLESLQQPYSEIEENGITRFPATASLDDKTLLNTLDLTRSIERDEYSDKLEKWQGKLTKLVNDGALEKNPVLIVFEGSDAAGKGGCIRRITQALDPRQFRVHSIGAPSEDELARPYLWRFWKRIPKPGRMAILDRSYYGRVLVERVEGFATESSWQRAFSEIRSFENQLHEANTLVVKFWLQISPEEQLKRFEDRETEAYKRYKLTDDDWRNRDKWDAYQQAAGDMFDRTSTHDAHWHIIPSEDKRFARIEVLKALVKQIEGAD